MENNHNQSNLNITNESCDNKNFLDIVKNYEQQRKSYNNQNNNLSISQNSNNQNNQNNNTLKDNN